MIKQVEHELLHEQNLASSITKKSLVGSLTAPSRSWTHYFPRDTIYNVTCSLVNCEGFAISVLFYMIMRLGCEKHVLGSLDYFRQSPLQT